LPGWWPSRVRTFLELDKPVEQMDYWEKFLNTWRFRYVFDVLLSVTVLRSVYHPRFLNFLPKRLGPVIRGRMERCFSRHPNRYNPFARSLFLGEFSSDPAPAQAKDIRLVHADAADFLENEPPGSFDGFTLSNILDGTDDAYRQRLFSAIKHTARPGAVTVIRSISEIDAASPNNHAAEDRSILWGSVLVRPVSEL